MAKKKAKPIKGQGLPIKNPATDKYEWAGDLKSGSVNKS